MTTTQPGTPGSQASLREANRGRVVDAVRRHGALTQVEVATATGLSPATVSNIVRELVALDVLAVQPTSRSGRRAQQVSFARAAGVCVGVDFGYRHLRVAVADMSQHLLAEQRLPLPANHRADEGLDRAALLVMELLEQVGSSTTEVVGVGLGVPAPVDVLAGEIGSATILPGWGGIRLADQLGSRLGVTVHVDNDANLGALAEVMHGAARGCTDAAYIKVSHGVGSGLVVGGQVFRGHGGTAGEIGHVSIDENGPVCRCGNRGCLETFVRAPVLLESLRATHGNLSLREVTNRARGGDPGCRRVVADAGRHIGVAAASLCNLLNPQRIVVGGGLAAAGDLLLDPLRDVVNRFAIPSAAERVTVTVSELAERAEVIGAVALAAERAEVMLGGPIR
ncbi:MAG TPA: ROK family transcriptional regulator [Actinomycetales bacterium]|nr:ROK family transcriptional regulator [Actinomycetales bacterium]